MTFCYKPLRLFLLQLPNLVFGRNIKPRTLGRITEILDKLHHTRIPQNQQQAVKVRMKRQERPVVLLVIGVKVPVRKLRFVKLELDTAHADSRLALAVRRFRGLVGFRDRLGGRLVAVLDLFGEFGGLAGLVDGGIISRLGRGDVALRDNVFKF